VQAGQRDSFAGRENLKNDDGVVQLYDDGNMTETTVGKLAGN
jgi:hypothetical protein